MSYEARYGGNSAEADDDAKLQRDTQNNANNIRNAADVAMASGNPYAMAAGAAVKAADKITKGKSTEAMGKGLAKANQRTPGGQKLQDASNKLSESGASDKIGTAASMKSGGAGGASKAGEAASKAGDAAQKAEKAKQAQDNAQRMQNAQKQSAF